MHQLGNRLQQLLKEVLRGWKESTGWKKGKRDWWGRAVDADHPQNWIKTHSVFIQKYNTNYE